MMGGLPDQKRPCLGKLGNQLAICDHLPRATAPATACRGHHVPGHSSQDWRVLSIPAPPGAAGHSEEGWPLCSTRHPHRSRGTPVVTPEGWSKPGNFRVGIPSSAEASKPRVCGAGEGVLRRKKGSYALGLKPSPPLW